MLRLDIFEAPVTVTPQQEIQKIKMHSPQISYFWGDNVYFGGNKVYFEGDNVCSKRILKILGFLLNLFFVPGVFRAELKGQTKWDKGVSAKIYGFLRFSARICGFLRFSAKICAPEML